MKKLLLGIVITFAAQCVFRTQAADPLDTWHVRSAPAAAAGLNLDGIAFGNGRWVAVGDDGIILSSADGVEWANEVNPAPDDLEDIVFGNGIFVAFGSQYNNLLTSPDGKNWTKQTPKFSGAFEMIYDGTRFVSVLAGGFVVASTDGVTWTNLNACPNKYDVGGIAFGNGIYVEAGYKRTGTPPDLYTTSDLGEWTKQDSHATENLMNVGFGAGTFVAVGQKGTITTSADGINWTPRSSPHTGFIWDITSDGQHLVAAAQWGRVLTSGDGATWQVHETGLDWHLTDIAYGNGTFIAVGWEAQIVQSDASSTGEVRLSDPTKTIPFTFQLKGEAGAAYTIQASADLKSWTPLSVVTAGTAATPISDGSAPLPRRFYRAVKQ